MRKTAPKAKNQPVTNVDVVKDRTADTVSGREIMQAVLAKPRNSTATSSRKDNRISGVVIGTLSKPAEDGRPRVYYPGIPTDKPLAAISTENLGEQNIGHEVALGFVDGDPSLPVILGLIQKTGTEEQAKATITQQDQSVDVQLDGERLTLSAEREIVLKCGKSSITLTRAGKVILKGEYLSTHSTGMNRIKGGSVQIN